jgi:hypothetical protein
MKFIKIIFSLLLLSNVFIGKAQGSKTAPEVGCPPGYHPIMALTIDVFNFHRPKYNCERGFFICIKGIHFEGDCTPDYPQFFPYFKDGLVHGYGLVLDGKIELHLPAALADHPGYAKDDMSIFSVEKDWVDVYINEKKIGTMKEGDYAVKRTELELIITVDLI